MTLDTPLTFLVKSAMRVFYYFQSTRWERTTAFVTGQVVLDPIWWGCPSVKLHYRFDSNGRSTKGWDVIPALSYLEARNYAESFRHNHPVTIRVNPKNPQDTYFFQRDHKRPNSRPT